MVEVSEPPLPLAVVMLTLNEAHNLPSALRDLQGFASEVFIVDSYSADDTVSIALDSGAHVVQRSFRGFGEQWSFAVTELPITAPWTMKLDPDERLSPELKIRLRQALGDVSRDGYYVDVRLHFLGKALPAGLSLLRVWRTGKCKFARVRVNEHATISGPVGHLREHIEHHDSPNLDHWFAKQNRYTSAEAKMSFEAEALAATPSFFAGGLARRMWFKKNVSRNPFFPMLMFLYCYFIQRAVLAGREGFIWASLRADVYRWIQFKLFELNRRAGSYVAQEPLHGNPDPRASQYE